MPINAIKVYDSFLELLHLNQGQRMESLRQIFTRDISENANFQFLGKLVRPVKGIDGEYDVEATFSHCITQDDYDEKGKKIGSRSFDYERAKRLHWIKYHFIHAQTLGLRVFSYEDKINGRKTIRTYLLNLEKQYVVILDPFRKGTDYYLITAYYLNTKAGKKQMRDKFKRKLEHLY